MIPVRGSSDNQGLEFIPVRGSSYVGNLAATRGLGFGVLFLLAEKRLCLCLGVLALDVYWARASTSPRLKADGLARPDKDFGCSGFAISNRDASAV